MRIVLFILIVIFFVLLSNAQSIAIQKKVKNNFRDSSVFLLNTGIDHSMQESFGASEESTANQTFIPSVLNSSRDLFSATAAFHFNNSKEARALLHSLPSKLMITKILDKLIHIVPFPSFGKEGKN